MSELVDEIKVVIADVMKLDTSEIKLDSRFVEDLKADSMDQFFLIDGLIEKFGITIPDEDARQIKTVADAAHYVEEHQK